MPFAALAADKYVWNAVSGTEWGASEDNWGKLTNENGYFFNYSNPYGTSQNTDMLVTFAEELDRARGMGACGYLPKNIVHTRLLEAMRSAVDGGPFQEEELPKVPSMLTAKEMSVLKYLAMGKTREEVGIILGVSTETVKTHSKSIQVKLDAPNTTGAVSRAYELGILRP